MLYWIFSLFTFQILSPFPAPPHPRKAPVPVPPSPASIRVFLHPSTVSSPPLNSPILGQRAITGPGVSPPIDARQDHPQQHMRLVIYIYILYTHLLLYIAVLLFNCPLLLAIFPHIPLCPLFHSLIPLYCLISASHPSIDSI